MFRGIVGEAWWQELSVTLAVELAHTRADQEADGGQDVGPGNNS